MFGFLKNLVRKRPEATAEEQQADISQETEVLVAPRATTAPASSTLRSLPRNPAVQRPVTPQKGRGVEVPLQAILNILPLELQPRVVQHDVGDLSISVPLEKILAQLSRGSVKVSFAELRLAAPDVFTPENDRDRVLVPLPLSEILPRINPALITCRRVQRQVDVPEDISSPFDGHGAGLTISSGTKSEGAPAAPPASRHAHPAPAAPGVPARNTITSAPTPPPPSAAPVHPPTIPASRALQDLRPSRPAAPVPPPAKPSAPPPPAIPFTPPPFTPPKAPVQAAAPSPAPAPAIPMPAAPGPIRVQLPTQKPAADSDTLLVGLTAIAEAWPDAVRQEIVHLNLVDGRVALPCGLVSEALKQGRISFTWKALRSWVRPSPAPAVSAHDNVVLDLPLKVVAPMFLARQREARKTQQQPVTIDEHIPNLFFGFPQSELTSGPSQAVAKPVDTNYYVWDDSSDTARVDETDIKRRPSPETSFISRYATPNEIVSRAAAIDGVAGALIALPDGLMVASQIHAEVNADTLAAFLPQIFGKVSQCTKELRMGELNNLSFTVGNVPWKIFRVNAIFFAAFGHEGKPLSTAGLAALAAELDHKPK